MTSLLHFWDGTRPNAIEDARQLATIQHARTLANTRRALLNDPEITPPTPQCGF
jgi:hypothetical protein